MSTTRKTPKLRFPEFTDDWEQRKVSEITTSYSGGTPKSGTAEYYDGNIPFIRSGEIYSNKTELFITELGLNNSSAKMVHVGDILYALYGATSGEVSRAKLDGAINQAILAVLPNEEINADFLVEWFRKEKENIIATYLQGGQGNLSAQIIKDLMVDIPSSGEQKKIGDYFTNLNNLITLHQRELDSLKKLKKSLLQKMFPKNGEKIPELRFPEFTGDWEQRKLSDISERVTRKNKNLEYSLPLTISAQYGLVDQHEFFNKRIAAKDVSGYYVIKNGEFAYNKSYSEGYPWGAVKRLDRYENGVLSTLYILFSVKNVDSDFLVSYYDTNNWHSEVQQRSAEGARNHGLLNISASDFFDTELVIPQDPNEQKKIGLLFKKLDSTITLHQRELDTLKKLKKGLLQNMFV